VTADPARRGPVTWRFSQDFRTLNNGDFHVKPPGADLARRKSRRARARPTARSGASSGGRQAAPGPTATQRDRRRAGQAAPRWSRREVAPWRSSRTPPCRLCRAPARSPRSEASHRPTSTSVGTGRLGISARARSGAAAASTSPGCRRRPRIRCRTGRRCVGCSPAWTTNTGCGCSESSNSRRIPDTAGRSSSRLHSSTCWP
jgi:hypothetical protein